MSQDVKLRRLQEVIKAFHDSVKGATDALIGREQLVLVEGNSKRGVGDLAGRTDQNRRVIFPGGDSPPRFGEFVKVKVTSGNATTLKGQLIGPGSLL